MYKNCCYSICRLLSLKRNTFYFDEIPFVKLPLVLKWLQHMHKHLDAFITAALASPARHCGLFLNSPKPKQVEKYTTRLWETPSRTSALWHGNYCCYPEADRCDTPSYIIRNDKNNRHFSFRDKKKWHSNRRLLLHTVRKTCFLWLVFVLLGKR